MAPINCPAPNCTVSWEDSTPSDVLLRLIDLHEKTTHPSTSTTTASASPVVKAEKVKHPVISSSGTSEEWVYFEQRWSDYKAATHLSGSDIIFQLLECCDETLRKDLTRTFGSLASSDEKTILGNIQTLAIRQENIMVARVQLQQMCKDHDEPVRAFAARLRGQAGICNFRVTCTCTNQVNYSDIMVRDALVHGLGDAEIRLDIMGEPKQDMSLEDVLKYIEAKESGKRSAARLLDHHHTGNPAAATVTTSSYKRQERGRPQIPAKTASCGHCGKIGHGGSRKEHLKVCPAYGHTCKKCGILHHNETVCCKVQRSPSTKIPSPDDVTAVFTALCTTDNLSEFSLNTKSLEHHIYNEFCEVWEKSF